MEAVNANQWTARLPKCIEQENNYCDKIVYLLFYCTHLAETVTATNGLAL
jgi:hypothetical protein